MARSRRRRRALAYGKFGFEEQRVVAVDETARGLHLPLDDQVLASLFQPDGPGTPAWLLTTNYRVILEYNCSNYYAMSVGLLADEISR